MKDKMSKFKKSTYRSRRWWRWDEIYNKEKVMKNRLERVLSYLAAVVVEAHWMLQVYDYLNNLFHL